MAEPRCAECGHDWVRSENVEPAPPAPPAVAVKEYEQPWVNMRCDGAIETSEGIIPNTLRRAADVYAESELAALREQVKQVIETVNLLPSVTHGPITRLEDVPFAIRDLQECYLDASRSRNAMNEAALREEVEKLHRRHDRLLKLLCPACRWTMVEAALREGPKQAKRQGLSQ